MKIKSKKIIVNLIPLAGLVLILELLSKTIGLPKLFLATPTEVLFSFGEIWSQNKLAYDILTTLGKALLGLSIGGVFGVLTGFVLGLNSKIGEIVFPYLDFVRSVPVVAFYSIFILLFGINDLSKVATISWGVFFIMSLASFYGVVYISKVRQNTVKILKLQHWTAFTKVILPASLPHIVSGLRTSSSYALVLSVVSEMFLGGSSGLGKRIIDSQLNYLVPELWAYIIILGSIGYLLNMVLIQLEKKVIFW
jgi:ABC-type nitrate/sulfonate/bicarbonate transport system permease component